MPWKDSTSHTHSPKCSAGLQCRPWPHPKFVPLPPLIGHYLSYSPPWPLLAVSCEVGRAWPKPHLTHGETEVSGLPKGIAGLNTEHFLPCHMVCCALSLTFSARMPSVGGGQAGFCVKGWSRSHQCATPQSAWWGTRPEGQVGRDCGRLWVEDQHLFRDLRVARTLAWHTCGSGSLLELLKGNQLL